jgi:hypothetical protein
LLGPLGKFKPAVSAECLFADPIADIAVLGVPDSQVYGEQADAYEELIDIVTPFQIGDAPKQGTKRIRARHSDQTVPTPGQGAALILSLEGEWVECSVKRDGAWLAIQQEQLVEGGMSGSPIVSMAGHAIGLISSGSRSPVLLEALPPRLRLLKHRT